MYKKNQYDPLLNPDIQYLFDIFEDNIRLVGGVVRDYLINHSTHDIDFATPLKPQQIINTLEQHNIKLHKSALTYGTITAVLNHRTYEITTLRTDIQTNGRHAQVKFINNYILDAKRRDLTINALYMDKNGKIFDYVSGLKDILQSKIRFIGDPEQRVKEDYLRILRFFRFYAFYGKGDPDIPSFNACQTHREGLKKISPERIQTELLRTLSATNPIPSLKLMEQSGIFDILNLSVDIEKLDRFMQITPQSNSLQRLSILTNEHELKQLRLSKAQQKLLLIYHENYIFRNKNECRYLLWKLGKDLFLFHLNKYLLSHTLEEAVIKKIRALKKPIFPITGRDLLQLNFHGTQIKEQLELSKKIWRHLNFCDKKELVLKKLLTYNKACLKGKNIN